jgi:hypothetical protein
VTLRRREVFVACTAAVLLAMGLSLRNGFVYDDVLAIVQNPRVTDPSMWHTIPGSPYWLGDLWRPLTVAGFAVQWWVGRGAPWIFHLVLLTAYLATGLALFTVLRRLSIGAAAALLATVLFLVHPVHVEVVANGVGQAELWTAVALLLATSVYLQARRNRVTPAAFAALLALVALGIAAKEQGFMVPLILAGAEWLLLADRKEPLTTRLRLLVPVSALAVLLLAVRAGVLGGIKGESSAMALRGLGIGGRLVTFLGVVPEYVRLLIFPVHLQADYGPPGIPIDGPITTRHVLGIVLLVAIVALFLRYRRRAPTVAFGLWWAGVTIAPVSNLLTATGLVMAERVLLLPSIGFAIVLGAVLQRRSETRRHYAALAAVLTACAIALTIRSAMRVATWRTQRRFYTGLPVDAPLAYRAWKGTGEYWEGAGDHPRAIADLRHAIELWPNDYEVYERLGQFLRTDAQCGAAVPILAAGLQLGPDVPSLRAKLIECLITERQWDDADRYAVDALARGQTEFQSERARVARLRATAGSTPDRP